VLVSTEVTVELLDNEIEVPLLELDDEPTRVRDLLASNMKNPPYLKSLQLERKVRISTGSRGALEDTSRVLGHMSDLVGSVIVVSLARERDLQLKCAGLSSRGIRPL